jgi:hypothetical protein
VVAGHGRQENRDYENGAEKHSSFGGEMKQRSTG